MALRAADNSAGDDYIARTSEKPISMRFRCGERGADVTRRQNETAGASRLCELRAYPAIVDTADIALQVGKVCQSLLGLVQAKLVAFDQLLHSPLSRQNRPEGEQRRARRT